MIEVIYATLPDPNPVEVLLTSEGGAANAALSGFRRKSAAKVRTIFGMTKQLTIKNNTGYGQRKEKSKGYRHD